MSKLNTGFFIARRLSSPEGGRKNVMVRIATITVAVGMAVMIVALAVIVGFKREISDKLVGFGGHVRIVNLYDNNTLASPSITVDSVLMEEISRLPYFRSISVYATKGGMLKTPDAIQGIAIKGIDGGYDSAFMLSGIVEGSMPEVGDTVRTKDLLISKKVADIMQIAVGDRVEVLFAGSDMPVRRDRYKICGLFATGMDELDKSMAFTDIRNIQRLNGWEAGRISGYEVMTTDFARLDEFGDEVYGVIFDRSEGMPEVLKVEDVKSLNPGVFDWLAAHDVNAAVIIVIMLLVALLNMISALLIILLEKTSMIGILKALGMTNWGVQQIFLFRSLRIVLTGILWGDIIGVGLAMLQKYTHLVKLESTGYMLSHVPIEFGWDWFLGLNIGVPVVMVLLLTIPAAVVTKIKPERTIRYQ